MLRKAKKFQIAVTHEDLIDVALEFESGDGKKTLVKFALSYRAWIGGKWHEVIRYDNAHGYVHAQRFWRGPEPVALREDEGMPLDYLVRKYKQDIVENWERYRSYIEERVKG